MRFDEYVQQNGIPFQAVDALDGYIVEVAVPVDWQAVESSVAKRVWIWRGDPCREQFCANAVLTLSRAEAALDPAEVFSMLCDWQAQMLPGIHELHREPAVPHDGPGVMGTLALLINTDIGVLESVVAARTITNGGQTLIAQLTFTALPESPVERSAIGFAVIPAAWAGPETTQSHGSAPAAGSSEAH